MINDIPTMDKFSEIHLIKMLRMDAFPEITAIARHWSQWTNLHSEHQPTQQKEKSGTISFATLSPRIRNPWKSILWTCYRNWYDVRGHMRAVDSCCVHRMKIGELNWQKKTNWNLYLVAGFSSCCMQLLFFRTIFMCTFIDVVVSEWL